MAFTPRTEEYADAASLSSPYDLTVYKPTGTAEGDILFALLCWYATVTIDSVPSGWTLLGDYTTNTDRYALYYKVAGASEPSTYTWSFTGNTKARITCSCYTGGDFNPSDPIAVYSNTPYPISDQYVKAASMSVPSANSPLVFWAGVYRIASATFIKPSAPSSDWVEDNDAGSTGSDFWAEVCSMIWAGSGNTGDMIATCTAILAAKHAFAVALKPAGGPIQYGSATMSGTGTLAALARTTQVASATLSGAGSLAALARLIKYGAATLSGTGSLSAAGTLAGAPLTASATLSGAGALAAMARAIRRATATLSGLGTLTATATVSLAGVMTATLLAAQKKPHRIPYVEAKVYDYEAGIKRLTWTRLYTGSEPDNHHGIAFDGQGSMHRIRAAAGYKLYYQKFTSPDEHSDYSSWALIASDCDGPCAIAASGARVYIFYRDTDNTLRKYYSHNYGVDWTNAELIPYTEVVSLAACWWGTGNIVVCFAIKSSYPAELNGVVLDTSDQGTTQHEWHDTNHPLLDTYGIGATYNPFWPAIEIVLAGKESDTPYHHFDLFRTKFSNTYNLLGLESFLMAPDGENITYQYPDCHLPTGALEHETNRIVAVEKFVGTTAYTRPITCHMVKGTYWSDTTFTEPRPFLDLSPSYGLRIASTSAYWWIEKPDGVWTAPRPAGDPLDLTRDIVSMVQSVPGTLVLELNNSKGQYALPGEGALASLPRRNSAPPRLQNNRGPRGHAGRNLLDRLLAVFPRPQHIPLHHHLPGRRRPYGQMDGPLSDEVE